MRQMILIFFRGQLSNFIVTKHIASSKATFSSYKITLKHFYTFLNYVNEIFDDQLKVAKKSITISGNSFYELGNMGALSDFKPQNKALLTE